MVRLRNVGWRESVGGHVDVGEDDVSAAVRETQEEVGLHLDPGRLVRFANQYQFSKSGAPNVPRDRHENPFSFVYKTPKVNNERISVFVVRLSEMEIRSIAAGPQHSAMDLRWVGLTEALREARDHAQKYASGFKHILGNTTTQEWLSQLLKEINQPPSIGVTEDG